MSCQQGVHRPSRWLEHSWCPHGRSCLAPTDGGRQERSRGGAGAVVDRIRDVAGVPSNGRRPFRETRNRSLNQACSRARTVAGVDARLGRRGLLV